MWPIQWVMLSALFQQAGSNSAADLRAFYSLSQPEAAFRENVWESGTQNAFRKRLSFGRVLKRHLSVDFRRSRKTVEISRNMRCTSIKRVAQLPVRVQQNGSGRLPSRTSG